MRKLAMAILLVAMLAIGLAGVAGATGNSDMSKDGCCEDGASAKKSGAKVSNSKKRIKIKKADSIGATSQSTAK